MKTIHLAKNGPIAEALLLFLLFCAGACQGQSPQAITTNQPDSADYVCVQRGPYAKVWQRSLLYTNASGDVTTNEQSYTELATGICYVNNNGQYVDSVEEVDPVPGGAQAIQGRHQVQWALNASTPGGTVVVTTPDGKQLASTVFGLAYYDLASGSNVAIAGLTNCNGAIAPPNQVLYANAFSNLTADVLYTYTLAGLSQDIVLHQCPPPPDRYGLSDQTAVLEVWTEFFNPPQPQMTAVTNGNATDDQVLDFGDMKMGLGQVLFLNTQEEPITGGTVTKQWLQVNNSTYLVESIPYSSISNQLQQLPHASNLKPDRGSVRRMAFLESKPALPGGSAKESRPMKLAGAQTGKPRLKIDYELLSSSTNWTLQGDTTYFVSGAVNITGTTTIEGGTVVKYTNLAAAHLECLGSANLIFNTYPWSPAIFTSGNDNTVGSPIGVGTNAPSRGTNTCIIMAPTTGESNILIQNARFSYAGTVYLDNVDYSYFFRNCQFFNCGEIVDLQNNPDDGNNSYVSMENVLISLCGIVISGSENYQTVLSGQNITADQCTTFSQGGNCVGGLTNCILTAITNGLTNAFTFSIPTNCNVIATNGTNIYQSVGAGGYYLANGSTNRHAGTSNIDPVLLTNLQSLTTYPPVVTNGWITNDCTLSPQVPRNTGFPDLGYHYFPLDYAIASPISNATVTVLPGTALAGCGITYGVNLYVNAIFNCEGTATSPNYFVQYNTVQEQSNTNWATTSWGALLNTPAPGTTASANFVFTDWSTLASAAQIYGNNSSCPIALQDCQLYTGTITGIGPEFSATNCLFQRANCAVSDATLGSVAQTFYNNLFYGGVLTVTHTNSGPYTFRDNLFVQTSNTLSGTINYCSSNAYVTTNFGFLSPTNGDVFLTNIPAFQTNAFGVYYYPANQTNLIHQGSQSAVAAGLYYYTVTTDNAIEGTNTVSIGFHYVATDSNDVPLGGESNGVPDYLEDPSGNGVLNPFLIFDQAEYPNEPQVRLGYWKFDNTNNWTNQSGLYPTTSNNLTGVPDWSGNAVSLINSASQLVYPVTEDGANYFNPSNGTVRFWYQPNWSTIGTNAPGNGNYGAYFLAAIIGSNEWSFYEANNTTNNTSFMTLYTASNMDSLQGAFNGTAGVPINFQSNLWTQIVLTYSPSNMALYTNGVLLATANTPPEVLPSTDSIWQVGLGNIYYPPASELSNGFSFGSQYNTLPVMGQLDELETFNYPLTAQQVAWGFPTFAGNATSNVVADSNYVGRSDMLQKYVDGNPTNVVQCRLGYWRFDSPFLYNEQGQMPLSSSNVCLAPSWSGTALVISNTASSQITYPDVGSNGWANINCQKGTLRFWFKFNGSAPTNTAPFVYLGGTNSFPDSWGLVLWEGNTIAFLTVSNGSGGLILSTPASCLSSSHWTQIALTYSTNICTLYTNGVPATTNTAGNPNWPRLSLRQLGMVIGNATAYNSPINGQFEEMETFNYELSASQIAANFQIVSNVDSNLDGIPDLLEDIELTTARPFLGAPVVITGTIVAAQFDMGGPGIGYSNNFSPPTNNSYRPTGMCITNCTDLGGGFCLDQTQSNEWTQYTINVLVPQLYMVDVRAQAIGANTGGMFLCEFTNTNGFHTNTGALTIPSTNWTDITKVVYLTNGVTVMKLLCTNNASSTSTVGRFNYISIYPWWQVGVTNITSTNTIDLYTNNIAGPRWLIPGTNESWYAATNNAIQIQNAASSLNSVAGGEILLPAGTFLVSQALPDEISNANQNAAVSILGNNVEIAGMGQTNTTLIAYTRVTTVFCLGMDNSGHNPQCVNFTLRDMTIEAQPHRAVVGSLTNTVYDAAEFMPVGGDETGALTIFYGAGAYQFAYNLLVTNCQFLSADRSIQMPAFVSNVMIRGCNFIPSGTVDTFGSNNVYTGQTNVQFEVSIFASGVNVPGASYYCLNLVVLDNSYDGNKLITTTNTNSAIPVTSSDFVDATNTWVAPDGLVWFQATGNAFIARNFITNNTLEAIQLNAGPASVVGNTFYTLVNSPSCCALAGEIGSYGFPGSNSVDNSFSFVGNWVYGDRSGLRGGRNHAGFPTVANVSGNWLNLSPIILGIADSGPGAVAGVNFYQTINLLGNELVAGGRGLEFGSPSTNALVMNNNFGSATYEGIGYITGGDSITSAQIFSNIFGGGVTFHVQLPYTNSFGWFLGSNTYFGAASNSVPLFSDPASSAIHIFN